MDDSPETVVSAYVQTGDPTRISHRMWDGSQWRCLIHGLVGPVKIVMLFELTQRAKKVPLVPDESPVEQFMAQFLHPVGLENSI